MGSRTPGVDRQSRASAEVGPAPNPGLVGGVLEKCGVRDKKSGALPAGFVVYFTLALAQFQ
ncbi:hypothetical protein ACFRCI_48245 [Streptomyces sp. NPDC056638]